MKIFLGDNFSGGHCPGGSYPGWKFSLVGVLRVGIVRWESSKWQFFEWEFSCYSLLLVSFVRTAIVHKNARNNCQSSPLMAWEYIWKYFSIGDERLSFWTSHNVSWAWFLGVYIMCLEPLYSQHFSINTSAISGPDLIFYDLSIGFPRIVYDTRILKSTSVFAKAERGEILVASEDLRILISMANATLQRKTSFISQFAKE